MHSNIFQEKQGYEEFKGMQFQLSYLMNIKGSFEKKASNKIASCVLFHGCQLHCYRENNAPVPTVSS